MIATTATQIDKKSPPTFLDRMRNSFPVPKTSWTPAKPNTAPRPVAKAPVAAPVSERPQVAKMRHPADQWLYTEGHALLTRIPLLGEFAKAYVRTDLPPSQRFRLGVQECAKQAWVMAAATTLCLGHVLIVVAKYIRRQTATALPFTSEPLWDITEKHYGFLTSIFAQLVYMATNGVSWLFHTFLNICSGGLTKNESMLEARQTIVLGFVRVFVLPFGYLEKGFRLLFAKIIENMAATGPNEPVIGPILTLGRKIGRLFSFANPKKKKNDEHHPSGVQVA